ncbi:MAG: CaiB/BaiF CoA-transferase family protein [Rhizobiaceae bacterium]
MAGPLAGIKIIEMAGIGPAPFTAMLLSDMGAEIIRVQAKNGKQAVPFLNTKFDVLARGRRSMAIDLKKDGAVDIVLQMIESADAVLEGFRPGVMERLGLGPDICLERNPKLVFGRMTGWGQTGPMAARAGHDINYIALSGVLNAIGPKDTPPPVPLNLIGDFGGGQMMAFGIVCAILEAQKSGKGQVVDVAMTDSTALMASMLFGFKASGMWSNERHNNFLDGAAHFYDTYECSDGKFMAVGAIEPQFYSLMLEVLGLADEEDFQKQNDPSIWANLKARMTEIFLTKNRDEWGALFEGLDACVSPVLDWDEAITHPHNKARGTFTEIAGVTQPSPTPKFSRSNPNDPTMPAAKDAHTGEILADWGISEEDVERLRATEAI